MSLNSSRTYRLTQVACAAAASMSLLSACSADLASFDDSYVPQSVEENYPIKVVEKPVMLKFVARPDGLQTADAGEVMRFAKRAAADRTTPVTISYASGSRIGRQGAEQAAALMTRQGIARKAMRLVPRQGRDDEVTLTAEFKVAETKPCGDWSQNLRGNQFNESGPNFGCTVQQNIAAMVADPQDFERPKPVTPAQTVSQSSAIESYNTGAWTVPVVSPDNSSSQ